MDDGAALVATAVRIGEIRDPWEEYDTGLNDGTDCQRSTVFIGP